MNGGPGVPTRAGPQSPALRIALFHDLPSGGAKRVVNDQVSRLSQHYYIDLFTTSQADQTFADIRPFLGRVVVEPFAPGRVLSSPFGRLNKGIGTADIRRYRSVMRRLAAEINEGRYDVALVHPSQLTTSPPLLRFLKVPSVYCRQDMVRTLQDPPIPRPYDRRTGWRERIDRLDPLLLAYRRLLVSEDLSSMRAATRTLTSSYFMRESIYRVYGYAPQVCYPGVDAQVFRPLGIARERFVLSVGSLQPSKGFDFLIESLARIEEAQRPPLVIVSNSRLEEEATFLSQLAAGRHVVLELKTLIGEDELVNLYNCAACVVYAPVFESLGLVPLEAMACGTPVVGVSEGGVRETVIEGQTGRLVNREPDEFAQAVLSLLTDPSYTARLGKQAREQIEARWTLERATGALEKHLCETAGRSGGNKANETSV